MKTSLVLCGALIFTFASCKKEGTLSRHRAEENLRRLAAYERAQLKVQDGSGFTPFGPAPEGEPWELPKPSPATAPVSLLTNSAGLLEEQYEVILDPDGRPGAMIATLGGDGGAQRVKASNVPSWFEARAKGRFGNGGAVQCLGLRGELVGGDLLNNPKYVESSTSCDISPARSNK
jgi:hypothetical protein